MRIPLKARVSLFRQRAILTVRYVFRLPIDEVRDQQRKNLEEQLAQVLEICGLQQASIETCMGFIDSLEARLSWYEARVPSIRKERNAIEAKLKRIAEAEKERKAAFEELVEAGIPVDVAKARIWPKRPRREQ